MNEFWGWSENVEYHEAMRRREEQESKENERSQGLEISDNDINYDNLLSQENIVESSLEFTAPQEEYKNLKEINEMLKQKLKDKDKEIEILKSKLLYKTEQTNVELEHKLTVKENGITNGEIYISKVDNRFQLMPVVNSIFNRDILRRLVLLGFNANTALYKIVNNIISYTEKVVVR